MTTAGAQALYEGALLAFVQYFMLRVPWGALPWHSPNPTHHNIATDAFGNLV